MRRWCPFAIPPAMAAFVVVEAQELVCRGEGFEATIAGNNTTQPLFIAVMAFVYLLDNRFQPRVIFYKGKHSLVLLYRAKISKSTQFQPFSNTIFPESKSIIFVSAGAKWTACTSDAKSFMSNSLALLLPIMAKAADVLSELGVEFEMTIISAHREPEEFFEYARTAEERGFKVIIAGAGKAAHLPGMCAAIFPMPVIGIPMKTSDLGGVDSLYSIVQMPSGIPVATVAINGAQNAGLLAEKILAVADPDLLGRLKDYSEKLKDQVMKKAEKLDQIGYKEYLKTM